MTIGKALFTSRSEEYETPDALFKEWDDTFHFTLDCCATSINTKVPANYFTKEQDALKQVWAPHVTWMNPPYGKDIRLWMHKARTEAEHGATVVCLVHARTDTRWWHEEVEHYAAYLDHIRGRVRFKGTKHSSPFPSIMVVYLPPGSWRIPRGWVREY